MFSQGSRFRQLYHGFACLGFSADPSKIRHKFGIIKFSLICVSIGFGLVSNYFNKFWMELSEALGDFQEVQN